MIRLRVAVAAVIVLSSLALAACASEPVERRGSEASSRGPAVPLADAGAAETPEVSAGSGASPTLDFTLALPEAVPGTTRVALAWNAGSGLDRFDVLLKRAAGEDYEAVASDLRGLSSVIDRGATWRIDWPTALIKVRGCTARGDCLDSNEQPLLSTLNAAAAELMSRPNAFGIENIVLSSSGNTLAARGPTERGDGSAHATGVFVYERDTGGRWQQEHHLTSDDQAFGRALALSSDGNTLVVSSPGDDGKIGGINPDPSGCDPSEQTGVRGAVDVYVRDAQHRWTRQAHIKSDRPEQQAWDWFGISVALSDDGSWLTVHSVYRETVVYARDARGNWRKHSVITFAALGVHPELGLFTARHALSGDGRVLAVAAQDGDVWREWPDYPFYWVSIRLFKREGDSAFRFEGALKSPKAHDEPFDFLDDEEWGDSFGSGLAFDHEGRTLAVGAWSDSSDASDTYGDMSNQRARHSGAVHVFRRAANGQWSRTFVKAAGAAAYDFFGSGVALSSDGRTLVTRAQGRAVNAPGVYRTHTGSISLPSENSGSGGSLYVLTNESESEWRHRAVVFPPADSYDWTSFSTSASDRAGTLALGITSFTSESSGARLFVY